MPVDTVKRAAIASAQAYSSLAQIEGVDAYCGSKEMGREPFSEEVEWFELD